MASGDTVQQIKERLTVVDVISAYVELHPAGKNFKGKSPFTNEKTPSFYVSPDRGMYYCFSSSRGGDIFTFIQEMEGVDFKGALKILADKAGVELVAEDPQKKTQRDRHYEALEAATRFFEQYRTKKAGAQSYLHDRGVTAETIAKWRIGYAPGPSEHGWRELRTALTEQGFTDSELLAVGLIKGADAGKEPYDLFRDRIMFPIFDAAGKVVAYSGRILSKDTEAPKYVNSPETDLFNKSEILYGYDKAKNGIRNMDFSLIVEGQFDVVMSHQAGYYNTVAVSGTALTPHHVMLLQRLSNRVVLALDNDRAGIAAVKRAAELMLARGMDVKVAKMEGGKDPADMVQHDVAEFKKVIGHASHVVEYLLDILQSESKDERSFKLKTREEILPYVAKIPNRIDQEHFEHIIAERLQTTNDAIHFEVERIIQNMNVTQTRATQAAQHTPSTTPTTPALHTHRNDELLCYMTVLVDVAPKEYVPTLVEHLEKITMLSLAELRATYTPEQMSALLFRLETYIENTPPKQLVEEMVDKINQLNEFVSKKALREQKTILDQAEKNGDEAGVMNALARISELQKAQKNAAVDVSVFGVQG